MIKEGVGLFGLGRTAWRCSGHDDGRSVARCSENVSLDIVQIAHQVLVQDGAW